MNDLQAAAQLVDQALLTGRIGTPVAVRIVAHGVEPAASGEPLERSILHLAAQWLADQPLQTSAFVSPGGHHQTKLITFATGKSALLSSGVGKSQSALTQIVVVGNHGTLCSPAGDVPIGLLGERPTARAVGATRPAQKPPFGLLLVAGDHTHQPMYAAAFLADPRCRLIGLTDSADVSPRRRELNQQLAQRLGIPYLAEMDAALRRNDVHLASICAEPERRGPLIVQAAKAGRHLYLDKPLAGSREHVRQIVDAVRQSAGVAHMFSAFTSTAVGRVRHVMEAGRLGRLLAVHCDYCFAKGYAGTATLGTPRRESPRPDRYELADAKRELTNIGVYPLVMLLTLLGRTPRRVAAATGNFFFAEHQSRDMEDFGHLLLEFEDGVIASVAAGRTGWLSHPRDGLNRTYLIGSEASVVIEPDAPRLELWSDAASWTPPPRNPEDPMGMWPAADDSPFRPAPKTAWMAAPALSPVNDAKYFLDCIEHGHDSEVPVEVAAGASEILFAAYQSAATGQPVDLPLS